jgi:hypothetical protein
MKTLIESLFLKTKTPSTLDPDASEIVRKTVPKLPHIGSGDIVRQIATFAVNFLNNKDATGLLLAQRPMRLFVENC